ncbi:SMP-30/gluconolactonase/LRE family protein [Pimelobacter simplex]|uniref:SMP-30/gluconolactonase/LRE family protein n=1 Tax=Nocardioides simplex TaxID=2045 RepID=UPI0019318B85|nr:SMP-30/gluconolactonase/LRE family protein [Pimelobacter simplex]
MSVQVVADGLGFTEGPVALPDGRVALVSISHGCVYVVAPSGAVDRVATGGGPNGLALGPSGELYVAQNGGAWGASGRSQPGVQVIRDGKVEYLATAGLSAPNDLAYGPDGRLWVTDTVAEMEWGRPETGRPGKVVAVDISDGAAEVLLEEGPIFLNGLAFSVDDTQLLVTSTAEHRLLAYPLRHAAPSGPAPSGPSPSELAPARGRAGLVQVEPEPRLIMEFEPGASTDGMTRTAANQFWVALLGADRLDLVAPERGVVASVDVPPGSLPTNVCVDATGGLLVTAAFEGALLRVAGDTWVSSPRSLHGSRPATPSADGQLP